MVRIFIVPVFVLILAGCRSTQVNTVASESFTDEKLLDSLVVKWGADNSTYLENLKGFTENGFENQHIENILVYVRRASKGHGEYEARRKSFLRFLFSNYDIGAEDFVVSENFQGEKIFYEFVFGNKKITFQNLVENWREIKSVTIADFGNLAENVRSFKRDSNCSLGLVSFSLITLFEKEDVITKLDDKACQTNDMLR